MISPKCSDGGELLQQLRMRSQMEVGRASLGNGNENNKLNTNRGVGGKSDTMLIVVPLVGLWPAFSHSAWHQRSCGLECM